MSINYENQYTDIITHSTLATQIPEFSGSDKENVSSWVRRVDQVAEVHRATDGVTLLAASSKLTKSAKT